MSGFKRGDLVIRAHQGLQIAIIESMTSSGNYKVIPINLAPKNEWSDFMTKIKKIENVIPKKQHTYVATYANNTVTGCYHYKGKKYNIGETVSFDETIILPYSHGDRLRKYSKEHLSDEELKYYNEVLTIMNK